MKKFTQFALAATAILVASCTKEDSLNLNIEPVPTGEARYAVITKTVSASTGDTSMVILTEESLESGSTTVLNNGSDLNEKSPTQWSASGDGKYIYSVQDAGGDLVAEVVQYYLDNATGLVLENKVYEAGSYHAWGMWGDNFLTARNGSSTDTYTTVGSGDDAVQYYSPMTSFISYGVSGGTATGSYLTANYLGDNYKGSLEINNGESANVVGLVTAGNYVYVSYATPGVSRYAIETQSGWDGSKEAFRSQGYGSYTIYASKDVDTEANTSMTSVTNSFTSASTLGTVPFPLTPGNAYIARYNLSDNLDSTPTIIATDKMGQAFARQYGNPYNTLIANDDDGYVYVFSAGVTRRYCGSQECLDEDGVVFTVDQYTDTTDASTLCDDQLSVQTTNKGASVMRIKYGESEFDSSFGEGGVMTFEDKMDDHTFSRVWHIGGTKYLLRVIHEAGVYYLMHHNYRDPGDAFFYIYDSSDSSIVKISGLPEPELFLEQTMSSIGEPLIDGGKIYLPMAPSNQTYPAIWVIDPTTASATKGLEVQCSYVISLAKLTAQ
ncbi:MAG: DUF4374 domain-containing protein [Rikenellaceae bacterium]